MTTFDRRAVLRIGAGLTLLPVSALTASAASHAGAAVTMSGMAFAPAALTVKAGTTVTFMNEDGAPHTATGDGWDTGRLNRGDSKDVTFDTAGTFAYVCAIHPSMKGTITVE